MSARACLPCAEICAKFSSWRVLRNDFCWNEFFGTGGKRADVFTAGAKWSGEDPGEDQVTRAGWMSCEARGVRSCLHPDTEETKLRAAQGSARPPDQQRRSHHLHPR